ncbi:PEBP-like protein [Xylariaceae sp. FL0016]|nr:PEBP-like protein [Xylariaceae sp. FL0016]
MTSMFSNINSFVVTQSAPTIGTQSQMDGTSFAVLMIDLDIPTDNPPETNTLLHWMQTGLTQSTSATSLNTTMGAMSAFMLQTSSEAAFASYFGPSPPAKIPLSHRYTQILVDTSDASDDALSTLKTAAEQRMGFDANTVLTKAGLADKVIAGNFFNVTNAGPVSNSTLSSGSSGSSDSSGSSGSNSSVTTPSSPSKTAVPAASAVSQRASALVLGIAIVGAVFFTL